MATPVFTGLPIQVAISPQPAFTIGAPLPDGTKVSIQSTTVFPDTLPRENYALFVRVSVVDNPALIEQAVGNPVTDNVLTATLPSDGVYYLSLVAFEVEEGADPAGKLEGDVVWDPVVNSLVQLDGATNSFVKIVPTQVPLGKIPFASARRAYLHVAPGKDLRNERLGKLLELSKEGRKAQKKKTIELLKREVEDFDNALAGAQYAFDAGRLVEAQRILRLLDLLRSDLCAC